MIEKLRQIAIFAKTAEYGSFRSAAKALQLSPSVVSHHISQLENTLGVALLYRSTRRLSLTHDGEVLLLSASKMLEAYEEGMDAISHATAHQTGVLKVTIPAVLAHSMLIDFIARFSIEHPNVHLSLDFTDSVRDMVEEGIDVAIRMGRMAKSTLVAKKFFEVQRYVVASPGYLEALPVPASPEDIESWNWLALAAVHRQHRFSRHGSSPVTIKPRPQIVVNDAFALSRLAIAGAGLATLPSVLAIKDIQQGRLQKVLPDWQVESIAIHAVWQPNATKSSLVARFIDSLDQANQDGQFKEASV